MKRFFLRAALKSLGVALFIIILIRINWGDLLRALFQSEGGNIFYLLFSLAFVVPLLYVKSFRWRLIQKDLGIQISQRDSLRYYIIGLFAGAATPGQLGDFIKTVYLHKKGYPGGSAFFGVLYDRIYDVMALAFVLFFGLALLSETETVLPVIYITAAVILVFLVFFLGARKFRKFITIDLFKHVLPYGIKRQLKKFKIDADVDKYQLRRSTLFLSFLLTLAAYGIVFYRYYLLLLTINLQPPFAVWFGGIALASFVTLIPISISGVGTRDAVLIGVFGTVGIEPEKAVAFSLLILLLMLFNGIIGLVFWMKNPLIPKKNVPL